MATSTKSKTTGAAKASEEKKAPLAPETEQAAEPAATAPAEQKTEAIDESQYVTVRNGFHGTLVYISQRTKEQFDWPEYGDEQEMELRELKSAKAGQKAFFTNNWFMLDDWVIKYLGVENYYKHTVDQRGLNELLRSAPDKIISEISKMNEGQKSSVGYRVREMIESGEIDSLRVITALEEALGIELIEK